jgi:hypothetical protein
MVTATFIDSTHLTCLAPSHNAEFSAVDVTNDGRLFTLKSLLFQYTRVHVMSLSSVQGPVTGGYEVVIEGSGFYPGAFCRFGEIVVPSQYINFTTIVCTAPSQEVANAYSFAVSLDGVKGWTTEQTIYKYMTILTEIGPKTGSSTGGDEIRVSGKGFDRYCSITCRFGLLPVPATVLSESEVKCITPPGAGTVKFWLETRDFRFKDILDSSQTLTYIYQGVTTEVGAFSVSPTFADVRGKGTSVVVKGVNFGNGMLCKFGDKISLAQVTDSSHAECIAPARALAEVVSVFLSHDGGKSWSSSLASFEYRAVVQSLEEPAGYLQGGAIIHVKGYGFNNRISLCVFGKKFAIAEVESQYLLRCKVPASSFAQKVQFSVTCNSSVLYDPSFNFNFKPRDEKYWGIWYVYSESLSLDVTAVSPTAVSTMGNTTVTVFGQGFDPSCHCIIGENTVKAYFLDAATLLCYTPPHAQGVVKFQVATFNQSYGFENVTLSGNLNYVPPKILSVEPIGGSVLGGYEVVVRGIMLDGAMGCRMGRKMASIISSNDSAVRCNVPPSEIAGDFAVQLVYGSGASSEGKATFRYVPSVNALTPFDGFILTAKQTAVFLGVGFSGEQSMCEFEGFLGSPAVVQSSSQVSCDLPTVPTPQVVRMWLSSSNQVQQTLESKIFNFTYNPVIQDIHPLLGATTGGTPVVLIGSGLSSITVCSFGNIRVPATVLSDMNVHCVSPSHAPGIVQVTAESISAAGSVKFATNPSEFTFQIMDTHVQSLYPSAGSLAGSTVVTVRGLGFTFGSFCRFGDVEVPVTYFGPDHVQCLSPLSATARSVAVEVSQVGGNEGFSMDGRLFSFTTNVSSVIRINPVWGNPGDVITVSGVGFENTSICSFGGRPSNSVMFISSTLITCQVPSMGTKLQEVVQVTSDSSQLYGGNVVFNYFPPTLDYSTIAIREITPEFGPTAGNTLVTVTGINFPAQAVCAFGDLTVPSTVISSTKLQCISPSHNVAVVRLEVLSRNLEAFSTSGTKFSYQLQSGTQTSSFFFLI